MVILYILYALVKIISSAARFESWRTTGLDRLHLTGGLLLDFMKVLSLILHLTTDSGQMPLTLIKFNLQAYETACSNKYKRLCDDVTFPHLWEYRKLMLRK